MLSEGLVSHPSWAQAPLAWQQIAPHTQRDLHPNPVPTRAICVANSTAHGAWQFTSHSAKTNGCKKRSRNQRPSAAPCRIAPLFWMIRCQQILQALMSSILPCFLSTTGPLSASARIASAPFMRRPSRSIRSCAHPRPLEALMPSESLGSLQAWGRGPHALPLTVHRKQKVLDLHKSPVPTSAIFAVNNMAAKGVLIQI
jgi:hypothetical protein